MKSKEKERKASLVERECAVAELERTVNERLQFVQNREVDCNKRECEIRAQQLAPSSLLYKALKNNLQSIQKLSGHILSDMAKESDLPKEYR